MNSTRRMIALSLATALSVQPLAGAQHTPPSPCPCTVDGGCYPKPITWGHYGTRWRTWPGVDFSAADAKQPGTSVLGPWQAPEPEKEEQHAPPSLESEKPKEAETEERPPIDTPPLNLPTLPFPTTPPTTTPPTAPPQNGTTPSQPPSLPPFLQPTPTPPAAPGTFRPLPGTEPMQPNSGGNPPRPAEVPLGPSGNYLPPAGRSRPATADERDAPPALPLHFTQGSAPAPSALAFQPSSSPRRLPAPPAHQADSSVVPAGASVGNSTRHQAQPAVYTPANDPPPVLPAFGR